jgi:lambda family phage portal protein
VKKKPGAKKSLSERIDNAIAFAFPKWALKRTAARFGRRHLLSTLNAYRGADKTRLNVGWRVTSGSADQDILPDLDALRERARDLNRNNDIAAGVTSTIVNNVVGNGISPQSRIDAEAVGLSETEAEEYQKRAEDVWARWIETADATGRLDFNGVQSLAERKKVEDGDVIAIPVMLDEPGRPYSLGVEVVEADRLATPRDRASDKNVRAGVELDEDGRPLAYFIRKTHPGNSTVGERGSSGSDGFLRLEAFNPKTGRRNVFHLFDQQRPGQTRGVPLFAPVLGLFNTLADYIEAELVSNRVAACFSAFITKTDALGAATANAAGQTDASGRRIETIEPGFVEYLSPGEKVDFAQPNKPGGNFDAFVVRIIRGIASGIGLSYEAVSRDYSKVNFSSARAAILEDRKNYRVRQGRQIRNLGQPFWEMLLEEAFLRGDLGDVPFMQFPYEMTRADWNPPGWEWVDPVKEVKAAETALQLNLTTLADELAKQGRDWEEILRQRSREEILRNELGLPAPGAGAAPATFIDEPGGDEITLGAQRIANAAGGIR